MVSLDLHNFFGTVQSNWVLDALKEQGYGSDAAWIVARLVSFKGHLPQGAVTSPMASNVAFAKIDRTIQGVCKEEGIVYTRYADDLTFSSNDSLLESIIKDRIVPLIQQAGYAINEKKTKVYDPSDVHYVLGYVVNNKVNVLEG